MFMIPFFFCGHGFAFLCLFLHALRLFMLLFELCNLTVLLDKGKDSLIPHAGCPLTLSLDLVILSKSGPICVRYTPACFATWAQIDLLTIHVLQTSFLFPLVAFRCVFVCETFHAFISPASSPSGTSVACVLTKPITLL